MAMGITPITGYVQSDYDDSIASTQYGGFLQGNGTWYILQSITSGSVTTYRYVGGSTAYTTNWTNRTSLTYDYYNNVFQNI